MNAIDSTPNRATMQRLVRRILLAATVIAGASCSSHKRAEAQPVTAQASPSDPAAPADPNGPSGPTPPTSPGDQAIPLQGSNPAPGSNQPGTPNPMPTVPPGGDEGSNTGGNGNTPTAARDAGAGPAIGGTDGGLGSGTGTKRDSGVGTLRDGGIR